MFSSILFPGERGPDSQGEAEKPEYFRDLYLDRIFDPILDRKKTFRLGAYFHRPVSDEATVAYRQAVLRDLEETAVQTSVAAFSLTVHDIAGQAEEIRAAVREKGGSFGTDYLLRGRLLDCADRYVQSIAKLDGLLRSPALHSEGLREFRKFLGAYRESEPFGTLSTEIAALRKRLSSVTYCMLIRNGTVKVRKYEGQEDHTVQILQLFEKFRENPASEYQREISPDSYAPHIENAVLDMVAKLYRDIFSDLDRFCVRRLGFPDPTIVRFSREVQFYLSWLEYISPFAKSGLPFCFPAVRAETDRIEIRDGFDLALASSLQTGKIVVNDFLLEAPERIIVVTGPNQGGKTTYARAFGQIHYLGALGLCVPAKEAVLILFDTILTHFEREENFLTENGKLQDDVVRLKAVFDAATAKSIVIINEIFSSTTAADAVILGNAMMDILAARGCPALCVTFLDELARHGKETVSMMSTVRPDAPASRTYKIIRKPPDGLAYAIHIAEKYGLTYEKLRGRLA